MACSGQLSWNSAKNGRKVLVVNRFSTIALIECVLALMVLATLFATAETSATSPRCKGNPAITGACFSVRGRLSSWNGNPTFRIWPTGTKRMLGVREEFDLPPELDRYVGYFDDVVYADFLVCPLTAEKPHVMQMVCVESATNITSTKRKQ